MDLEELKDKALMRLTKGPPNSTRERLGHTLLAITSQPAPCEADIAILEHFVNATRQELDKTVYFNGKIYTIQGVATQHKLKK